MLKKREGMRVCSRTCKWDLMKGDGDEEADQLCSAPWRTVFSRPPSPGIQPIN
jgi:hypothetical protein